MAFQNLIFQLFVLEDTDFFFFLKHLICLGSFCIFAYEGSDFVGKCIISQTKYRKAVEVDWCLHVALFVQLPPSSRRGLVPSAYPGRATFVQWAVSVPTSPGGVVSRRHSLGIQTTLQRQ